MTDPVEAAVSILTDATPFLVFTGAGISTESGIPDFRGPEGLWTKVDPADFTIQRWRTDREIRIRGWRMHQAGELWGARSSVAPNRAHHAVTRLWADGLLTGCVTQNVDGLHGESGLPDSALAEVHGNTRTCVCTNCDNTWPTEAVLEWIDAGEEDPHCPDCGALVKTSTIMFGEMMPFAEMAKAEAFADQARAVLVIGSTMGVYPAADIPLSVVSSGRPMVIVNLGPTDHDHRATLRVEGSAGEMMERIAAGLID